LEQAEESLSPVTKHSIHLREEHGAELPTCRNNNNKKRGRRENFDSISREGRKKKNKSNSFHFVLVSFSDRTLLLLHIREGTRMVQAVRVAKEGHSCDKIKAPKQSNNKHTTHEHVPVGIASR
jgi:hypothetical protein